MTVPTGESHNPGIASIAAKIAPPPPHFVSGKEFDSKGRERIVHDNGKGGVWLIKKEANGQQIWDSVMREVKQVPKGAPGEQKMYNVQTLQVNFVGQDGRKYVFLERNEKEAGSKLNDVKKGVVSSDMGWHLFVYSSDTPTPNERPTELNNFREMVYKTSVIPPGERATRDLLEPIRQVMNDWSGALSMANDATIPVGRDLRDIPNQLAHFGYPVPAGKK